MLVTLEREQPHRSLFIDQDRMGLEAGGYGPPAGFGSLAP